MNDLSKLPPAIARKVEEASRQWKAGELVKAVAEAASVSTLTVFLWKARFPELFPKREQDNPDQQVPLDVALTSYLATRAGMKLS